MIKNILAFFFVLIFAHAFAQDSDSQKKMYLYFSSNGSGVKGKIIAVPEEGKIQFAISENIIKTVQKDKILIAFNDNGNYLLVSNLSDDAEQARRQLDDFYTKNAKNGQYDIIFRAVPFEIIPCKISYNRDAINYKTLDNNSASINKENVLAIILKDGSHEIVRDIIEVAPILSDNTQKFEQNRQGVAVIEKTQPAKIEKTIVSTPVIETKPVIEETPIFANANRKILSEDEKEVYKEKSISKVQEFKDYLNIIGDKRRSPSEKNEAIKNAVKLFTPGSTIEVTSKNRPGARKIPVETYLKNLSNLNYSSISIEYVNLKFVTEFTQADDGNYYGMVSGEQSFMGYGINGNPAYSDVVRKNYKVKLESYQKFVDGNDQTKWKVLFGDVSVSQ